MKQSKYLFPHAYKSFSFWLHFDDFRSLKDPIFYNKFNKEAKLTS